MGRVMCKENREWGSGSAKEQSAIVDGSIDCVHGVPRLMPL